MIAALILAGGNASRLGGGDKPLLRLGTTTLLDLLLAALRPQASALAISANGDPSRFARFGLPVLPDASAHAGPLAGVAAGLAWAASLGAGALLTVPGDTPFIPKNLASRLGQPPAWAVSDNAIHPLIALWPTSAAPRLQTWLASGTDRRVKNFGAALGMRAVTFEDSPDPFFNINTPADLAAAQARAATLPAR